MLVSSQEILGQQRSASYLQLLYKPQPQKKHHFRHETIITTETTRVAISAHV